MIDGHEMSTAHLKILIFSVGILLSSIYFSSVELRYLVSGEDREVSMVDTYEFVRKTRRSESERRGVRFMLPDVDQGTQMVALEFPGSWTPPTNGKLWVTWIPGSSPLKVRHRDDHELFWLLIPLGGFLFLGIKIRDLWRKACVDADAERRSR